MKKLVFILCVFYCTHSFAELNGDQKDACAAVLCLSSATGRSVSECQPALDRYFSINAKKWVDTLRQREDFLNLCPLDSMANHGAFINDVNNGAGRCDAATLNNALKESKTFEMCRPGRFGEETCTQIQKYRINNQLPGYCQNYINNQYTDFKLSYLGQSTWQTAAEFSKKPDGQWFDN